MDNLKLIYEVAEGDMSRAGEASSAVKQTLRKNKTTE